MTMARKNAVETQEEATIDESAVNTESESVPIPGKWVPEETAASDPTVGSSAPGLRDGHDQVIEETGIGGVTDMSAPMGDPGDLGAFGQSAQLPDDLGLGDGGFGGPVDPGTDLGSTLLDDLAGDLPDPGSSLDGMSDYSGPGELDDQTGWKMAGNEDDTGQDSGDRLLESTSAEQFMEGSDHMSEEAMKAYMDGNDVMGAFLDEVAAAAKEAAAERNAQEDLQSGGAPDSESMPAPDDGTGGDPDAGDFIGERGDADPPAEAQDHGGGDLIGGRGDVDPAPDSDDAGGGAIDTAMLGGGGAIDPLEGESSLLGGDTGDLVEMTDAADLNGEPFEIEFDASATGADIGGEEA
jgi:hypothetical protein